MVISNKISLVLWDFFLLITYVLFLGFNTDGKWNWAEAIFLIAINISLIIKTRKNWLLLFICLVLLYSNYSICVVNYWFRGDTYFAGFANDEVALIGIHILLTFNLIVYLFAPICKTITNRPIIENNRYNPIIELALFLVLCLIFVFGFGRPDVEGQRGSPSTFYEYSIILFIIGYFYSGTNKLWRILYDALLLAFAFQNFVFGGRVTGLQLLICMCFCLWIDKINFRKAFPFMVVLFLYMSIIGTFRASQFSFSWKTAALIAKQLQKGKFALDTAYSSYFTSLTFLKTLNFTTLSKRIDLFFRWLASIVAGGIVPDSNLAKYTRQFFVHYYGGVYPFFGYFYLGAIGVVLFSVYVAFWLNKIASMSEESNSCIRCIAIYISCSSLRWYLYSPSQITRGILIMFAAFNVLKLFDEFSLKGGGETFR